MSAARARAASPQWLSTADVARIRGWSRVHAWRWLSSMLERGEEGVERRGRSLFALPEALERAERVKVAPEDILARRLDEIEPRLMEAERRLDVHATAMKRLHML